MNKRLKYFLALLLFVIATSFYQKRCVKDKAIVQLVFINTVKNNKLVLNDSVYMNPFGEKYIVTKLKYYVSDISLETIYKSSLQENNGSHLIDAGNPESQVVRLSILDENKYAELSFLLGVDSLHNVSGAQSGDLDPDKDMFWTWNTGYVMAKMEGNSPASPLVNNKFEYHIGGFSGPFNVLKNVTLIFPVFGTKFEAGKNYKIIISADVNKWWQSSKDLKIAQYPAVTTPGALAKSVSDNYANMFHIEKITGQ